MAGVNPHYHAISPDDPVVSACGMPEAKFHNLVVVEEVDSLDQLPGFEPGGTPDIPPHWSSEIRAALLRNYANSKTAENLMNGTIQSLINDQGFQGEHVVENGIVQEKQLSTLFGFRRANGLPISLQSRPDFSAAHGNEVIFGEGKNGKYVKQDAIRQSAGYLLANLYNDVVKRKIARKAVYGMCAVGSKCNDMGAGKFAVVLMSLSLPENISRRLQLKQLVITETQGTLDDTWTFISRMIERSDANFDGGGNSPALLQVPHDMLLNPLQDVTMIKNGTASLVLRVENENGWNLLKDALNVQFPIQLKQWDTALRKEVVKYPFFFKSKNFLLSDRPHVFYCERFINQSTVYSDDLNDAYKVSRVNSYKASYFLICDLGHCVLDSQCPARKLKAKALVFKFGELMKKVAKFQETMGLYHGDIHLGNITYHLQWVRFCLIDYDEATEDSLNMRTPITDGQKRIYPRNLVGNPLQFGKHQLMMALEDLLEEFIAGQPNGPTAIFNFFANYPDPDVLTANIVDTNFAHLIGLVDAFGAKDILYDVTEQIVVPFAKLLGSPISNRTRQRRLANGRFLTSKSPR